MPPPAMRRLARLLLLLPAAAVAAPLAEAAATTTASTVTASTTTLTETSTTETETTSTTSTETTTTSTSTTTTTPAHVYGSRTTERAYGAWLRQWRKLYKYGSPCGVVACLVPELSDEHLPMAVRGIRPKVVMSNGGVAGGVVTEGMGYGIMVEGFEAAQGSHAALEHGLALVRSWLGMVRGPFWGNPLAGGFPGRPESATKVDSFPYGVSAIAPATGGAYAGIPAWKWPLDQCEGNCNGTATDGDQDAVLGMIYLSGALGHPEDFVDMVLRSIVSFASADLGFPDLYRTLPGGEKMYVPKMGSTWGGLTPEKGRFETMQEPWCYSPGYFAPGHYRAFREFAREHWQPAYYSYLPKRLDGTSTTLGDLLDALESAATAGYNILYRSSCKSGSVSNWVGVEAACENPAALHCEGVPWRHTPYVGKDKGTCSTSHTDFGTYGADASRAPWRIAMDFILYRDESNAVTMYDREGKVDKDLVFGSQTYLNQIVGQYKWHTKCDGGKAGACLEADSKPPYSPWKLAFAFDPKSKAPDLTCDGVPEKDGAGTWWATYMSYPTFTAFVAPHASLTPEESQCWMDTFMSICHFDDEKIKGPICGTDYFDLSQAVVATMVVADRLVKQKDVRILKGESSKHPISLRENGPPPAVPEARTLVWRLPLLLATSGAALALLGLSRSLPRRRPYERLLEAPLSHRELPLSQRELKP